ncbi:DUF3427 domain-containing protein [Paratractidigestivibacter sp.]|uniref:DUF3427 domain-containing protein n=1 Tax=Paratractidigestivibacter sp. TaxID=2847316 RepID=UPI003AB4A66F
MAQVNEENSLVCGLRAGFVDAGSPADDRWSPKVIANNKSKGSDLLTAIKEQLSTCDSFDFCVAFIADSGLQPLVEVFSELRRRGVRGRLLTSTYLNFNSPDAFRKLLEYDNIEVRIYQGNLHAKGYVFDSGDTSTVIVGSSNLTQMALTCNREWNILFRSFGAGGMLRSIKEEFAELWGSAETVRLSSGWISAYEEYRKSAAPAKKRLAAFHDEADQTFSASGKKGKITPNAMQAQALEALAALHGRGETRALLVSATGTGKTYLSAFDVLATKPSRVLFLAHRQRILTASMASYKKLFGNAYSYGLWSPGDAGDRPTCVFAMCSTIVRHLGEFDPAEFDYIVIDEAHRVGSSGYQKILDHFKPRFCLGMTATPSRTDGFDVFAVFNHVIAFQITLQDALANEMLAPFHYFGIADLEIDDAAVDDPGLFSRLTSDERVRHITEKIEEYTVGKSNRRGLIFCNRNDEAAELSRRFNQLGYRTTALSGANTDAERNDAIARLESGELEYIFSVDIFNEGVDIPSLNQIVMLRRTESAIVFVQQLGRGLRKADDKEYALVLDFIGNYQQNFFVPIALSGDRTYNKDNLRAIVKEGSSVIPGCSTVSFDEVSKARIYKAIDGGDFSGAKLIRDEYRSLRYMLGHIPGLADFDANGAIDPLRLFKKFGSYHVFLSKYEPEYETRFSEKQATILEFVSRKLANGKRYADLELLRGLVAARMTSLGGIKVAASRVYSDEAWKRSIGSAVNLLSGDFGASGKFVPLVQKTAEGYELTEEFSKALENVEFKRQVLEVLDFGIARNKGQYAKTYKETGFVLNAKYTYEEVCGLLGWDKNISGQNIGGYKYDAKTNTYPVFINYDKDPDISESIKYEDRFVSESKLIAITKQPRNMDSPEIKRLQAWPGNGMKSYLFVRKNKDDKDGSKEFYFLGEIRPTQEYAPITIAGKSAVEVTYDLDQPVDHGLFAYLTSSIEASEEVA